MHTINREQFNTNPLHLMPGVVVVLERHALQAHLWVYTATPRPRVLRPRPGSRRKRGCALTSGVLRGRARRGYCDQGSTTVHDSLRSEHRRRGEPRLQ